MYTSRFEHMATVRKYIGNCRLPYQKEQFIGIVLFFLLLGSSSTHNGKQHGMQLFNSVGEDKVTMFSEYKAFFPADPRWYEFFLCICRSGDFFHAPTLGEELSARDAVRLYKGLCVRTFWSLVIQVQSSAS